MHCTNACAAYKRVGPRDPARNELIEQLYPTGLSTKQIAQEVSDALGIVCTKGMVIGVAMRAGLKHPRQPTNAGKPRRPTVKKEPPPKTIGLSLAELTSTTCRFPDDAGSYCGQACDQAVPYCNAHMAIAYQPDSSWNVRKRRKKPNQMRAFKTHSLVTGLFQ